MRMITYFFFSVPDHHLEVILGIKMFDIVLKQKNLLKVLASE